MTGLVTQPYRRPSRPADDNFLVTLAHPYDLPGRVHELGLDGEIDLDAYHQAHGSNSACIWAVHPNRPGTGVWNKMQVDDLVVFYGYGEVYAYGFVASKTLFPRNNYVWPSGENWDLVYSIRNFVELPEGDRLDYESLRTLTGKLGRQSVGYCDLTERGLSADDLVTFVRKAGPRRDPNRGSPLLRGPGDPPRVGEKFSNREAIWEAFGGHRQYGILQFEGDEVVNVFAAEGGPYNDTPVGADGLITYQGQGLKGPQRLAGANERLDSQRRESKAVRYWTGPKGGPFTFETWAMPLAVDFIEDQDSNGEPAKRFVWFLQPVAGPLNESWPEDLLSRSDSSEWQPSHTETHDGSASLSQRYQQAVDDSEGQGSEASSSTAVVKAYRRSRRNRRLVLERAGFTCENPACNGLPPDVGSDGLALLDVDHLDDLAAGGPDAPSNMIALCPNCHRAKTLGKSRVHLVKRLKRVVREREAHLLTDV